MAVMGLAHTIAGLLGFALLDGEASVAVLRAESAAPDGVV